jgi:hypothetical protein
MSILSNIDFKSHDTVLYSAETLHQLLIRIGEYKGLLRTSRKPVRLLDMLALSEVYHALESKADFDELIWYSSAELGKQKMAGFDEIVRWRDAYVALWKSLKNRPLLNTSILQRFMASALGRNKQIRRSADSKVSVSDRMKQVDVFLNLDSTHPVAIRSLLVADTMRRIKPFHEDGAPLVKLLPGLLVAMEYELPLPLLGYTRSGVLHTDRIDGHLEAMGEGIAHTIDIILELQEMRDQAFARALDLLPARMRSGELFDLIYSRPVSKVRDLVDTGIVKRQTAAEYLKALEDVRMLQSRAIGREMMYRNEDVVGIIEH